MAGILWIVAVLALLTGCSSPGGRQAAAPPLFGMGSVMVLHRAVEIPAERTRVYFQRGKRLSGSGFDRYQPSCDLEVRTLRPEPRQLEADRFDIIRIEYGQEAVARLDGVQLAGIGIGIGIGIGSGAGIGYGGGLWWDRGQSIFRYVRIWLHSDRQPDVMRLTCRGAWEDSFRASPPSDVEIRIALGDIISFEGAPPDVPDRRAGDGV